MKEQLVPVYMASTVAVAQKLADRLAQVGIEAFVHDTESPLYGMSLGPHSKVIHVRTPSELRAREIIRDFNKEYGFPAAEDRQGEETGLELPKPQRPSDDSPNEPYSPGTERMAASAGPEGPETAYMRDESGEARAVRQGEIESFDVDRPPVEPPEVVSPGVEEQPVDELDVSERLDVEEAKHPVADSPRKKRGGQTDRRK